MTVHMGSQSARFLIAIATFVLGQRPAIFSGQSQAGPLAFEVVSIKLNKPGQRRELALQYLPEEDFPRGRFPFLCWLLKPTILPG